MSKKVFIGADHAGFELKEFLKPVISELGFEVEDKGAHSLDGGDDYPDYCVPVAQAVIEYPNSFGIVIGGSGQGEAIVANKFPGVRAVVFNGNANPNLDEIRLSREHNDANVLSLGARFLSADQAKDAVKQWLSTEFPGDERHVRRIEKISHAETIARGDR